MTSNMRILTILLFLLLALGNIIMPIRGISLNLLKKYESHRENQKLAQRKADHKRQQEYQQRYQQWEREKTRTKNVIGITLIVANTVSFGSTYLLFKGGMALPCALSAMVTIKIVDVVAKAYPYDIPKENNTMAKACVNLIFSGAAFCFNSRSMELVGGVSLFFMQLMAL